MSLTVAIVATLALAAQAEGPRSVADWRARSADLYAQGDYRGALAAADQARRLDQADPWARYEWLRALAAVDPEAARRALPGQLDGPSLARLPMEERAQLQTALGFLCLDLGVEPLAAALFDAVPAEASSHPQAQAGLAMLAVRRGNSRQALVHFVAARATVRRDPSLAELEREAKFEVVLKDFATARDLRDANAAGRAYAILDELRPNHPETLRARADLAALRGDAPARERALRELLAFDRNAPGAASQLVETLLAQKRPYDAFVAARDLAPDRLAQDPVLRAIERQWVSHLDASVGASWRNGRVEHDRLELPGLHLAWTSSHPRHGRFGVVVDALAPDSDRVPAGEPFGSAVALPSISDSQSDKGVAVSTWWAPGPRLSFELGGTPSSFRVSNVLGAVRLRVDTAEGPWSFGLERDVVDDSLLSLAGTVDPVSGRTWGGITRNRAYFGGRFGGEDFSLFGLMAGAVLDGRGVDSNTQWQAGAGFLKRAASADTWSVRLGGAVEATGYDSNLSHFTLGHGGYFSPEKFLSVGPIFEWSGRRADRSVHLSGGVSWQAVREAPSDFFPEDRALQLASGDPRYPRDSRDGVGARLSASVEWRVSDRAVAGVRLEGIRGEDADLIRLQVYTRRWDGAISEPLPEPPALAAAGRSFGILN